jgi:hypothetical protein
MKNLDRIDNAIRMLDSDIAGLTSACHVADAATTESHLRRLEAERASLLYERMEAQAAAKQLMEEYGETDDNVDDFAAFDTDDDDGFFLWEEEPLPEVSPAAHICNMWHGALYDFMEKTGFLEFVDTMTCKIFTSADTEEKYRVSMDVGACLINRWEDNENKWCDGKQDSMDAIIYLALLDAWRVYCKQDKKQRGIKEDENNGCNED